MKISKIFHWLYASLMFLPLMVIPIFAIYSQRHTIDNNSVTIGEEEVTVYHFNQYVINGEPDNNIPLSSSVQNFSDYGTYLDYGGDIPDFYYFYCEQPVEYCHLMFNLNGYCDEGDIIYYKFQGKSSLNYFSVNVMYEQYVETTYTFFKSWFDFDYVFLVDDNVSLLSSIEFIFEANTYDFELYLRNIQCFNLTKIYGKGKEPNIINFNNQFNDSYYDYTLDTEIVVSNGVTPITYNDTDIGSQFIYQLYNINDKYFNIKNWMNLDSLYDWFILNIFNGSNSLVLPIIFNLITYWLVISFIWLIFDILMYVPSMIHKMLDKARME